MKRYLILALALMLALSALPAFAATTDIVDVTQYTYEVQPIFKNYCFTLYVKTDNPDPSSFRLVDKDSVYCKGVKSIWKNKNALFADVKYEDPATYRVNGGYIFVTDTYYSDGGDLILQQRKMSKYFSSEDYSYHYNTSFADTDVVVKCPTLIDDVDSAIAMYTDSSMDFFEKLDALQKGLEKDAVYPRTVLDTDAPNETRPYPMLALAYYQDLDISTHLDAMYDKHPCGMLIMWAYPFVLDSVAFPSLITVAARRFDPDCTIESTYYHYMKKITHDGQSKLYGGEGTGSTTPLYSSRIEVNYSFDGAAGDLNGSDDLNRLWAQIVAYEAMAQADAEADKALVNGDAYMSAIRNSGGAWLRIGQEGQLSSGTVFIYAYPLRYNTDRLMDCWVDGRYVGARGELILGETFDQHPNADIVERRKTVTYDGETYSRDVLYTYDSASDTWKGSWYEWYTKDLASPPSFTLTRSEVEALRVDANTFKFPASGLIFDGKAMPGTVFEEATLTYLANNGQSESAGAKKFVPIEIGTAIVLEDNLGFTAPTSPEGLKFKAWSIDDVEYAAGEAVIPQGDITAKAVWQNFYAQLTDDRAGIQVYAGCAPDFNGKLYCVFYDYSGQCVSVESVALSGGDNDVTFSLPQPYPSTAEVIVVDSTLAPQAVERIRL